MTHRADQDLSAVFIGSRGTLGIIVAACFHATPLPASTVSLTVLLPSWAAGIRCAHQLIQRDLPALQRVRVHEFPQSRLGSPGAANTWLRRACRHAETFYLAKRHGFTPERAAILRVHLASSFEPVLKFVQSEVINAVKPFYGYVASEELGERVDAWHEDMVPCSVPWSDVLSTCAHIRDTVETQLQGLERQPFVSFELTAGRGDGSTAALSTTFGWSMANLIDRVVDEDREEAEPATDGANEDSAAPVNQSPNIEDVESSVEPIASPSTALTPRLQSPTPGRDPPPATFLPEAHLTLWRSVCRAISEASTRALPAEGMIKTPAGCPDPPLATIAKVCPWKSILDPAGVFGRLEDSTGADPADRHPPNLLSSHL
ncbi:hypothetical protein IWQ60_006162 [Tieghemiomyces parasiticus]|uniref:Alkylglycerone-phosphate synthase n=1 Tax=Tieghemiomyces parasiticus TaxID=78921 RepID=A0A9W8A4X0_9FUNG|nr:hypothetical protein IWQ60_006162 [Tieghemiomyces parasiticus]